MDDGARRTLNGLKCFTDDMVTALGQHLNGDVVRDAVAIDQGAQEVVLGLDAAGKPTSISLKPILMSIS